MRSSSCRLSRSPLGLRKCESFRPSALAFSFISATKREREPPAPIASASAVSFPDMSSVP